MEMQERIGNESKIRVKFSRHAERQLKERNISESIVTSALEKPEQILQSRKGRKIARKMFDKDGKHFLLRVIFSEENDVKKVITVYCTSRIDRYRR
jgi:hypothetical protein